MATTPPAKPTRPKRPDDRRGTAPTGVGSRAGTDLAHHRGNAPFVPTEDQRAKVRAYAKTFPVHGEHYIAALMGFSRDTLRRHFADDMLLGRAEMLASVGSQMVNRAMNAEATGQDGKPIAKGDLDAQKFILARLGGWTTKVEVGDKASIPFGGETPDLSRLSEEELEEYGRLAAIAEGLDPDEIVGNSGD